MALPAPTDRERTQWYFQRYIDHLPAAGEIVLFDRSWYNRAGVERVMGFCTEDEHERFLRQCPTFERMLVDDGIILLKYWFSVSDEEQAKRFEARIDDPLKQWKLSPMDLDSRSHWVDYSRAKDVMFKHTDIPEARWHVVESDDKRNARINCISHLLASIPYEPIEQRAREAARGPGRRRLRAAARGPLRLRPRCRGEAARALVILDPNAPSFEHLADADREAIEATIGWFEGRGKVALKDADREHRWYSDYLAFQAQEGIFSRFLTPARDGGGDPERRWDTQRISALSEVSAFYGLAYWYTWQVTILGLGPIFQSANEAAEAARRAAAPGW